MFYWKFLCLFLLSFSSLAGAREYSESTHFTVKSEEKFLSTERFDKLTEDLRSTIAGNFVTVLRSEWKTKLSLEESNYYLQQLLERFLSAKTKEIVLKDLSLTDEDFAKKVSQRFFALQKNDQLVAEDRVTIRDEGPQQGVVDSTFTYYTKPLSDENGIAKHQIRLRSYLRRIDLNKLKEGETATAYTKLAEEIKITKIKGDKFLVLTTFEGISTRATLLASELHELFGNPMILFSIPGAKFKFEIKTVLKDVISGEKYPKLAGNHMVQKLDVNGVSFTQIEELFALEDTSRIDRLEQELFEANPENKERIQAVLAVVRQGVANYGKDFLVLEGATHYERSAFGGGCGFQTTIDREQEVYLYHPQGSLKDPRETIRTSACYVPKNKSERHVELKFPSEAVAKNVGVSFYQTSAQETSEGGDHEFQDAAAIYHRYPKDSSNQGKFKYLIDHGVLKK